MIDAVSVSSIYKNAEKYAGSAITVAGWIRTIRDQKQFGFISLNDGTFFQPLQIVFERGLIDNYGEVSRFGNGSAIIVTGKLIMTPDSRQPFELKAEKIVLEGGCPPEYPLQP